MDHDTIPTALDVDLDPEPDLGADLDFVRHEVPADPSERRVTAGGVAAIAASWLVLMIVAALEPPLPDDLAIPLTIDVLSTASFGLFVAAMFGLFGRRPWAALSSAAAAGIGLVGAVWCVSHLGVGPHFLAGVTATFGGVGASLAAFARAR